MAIVARKRYCCDAADRHDLESYYVSQAGSGGVYMGSRGQSGHGIGSFFGNLFRSAVPYFKRIGGQVLKQGARVASDVLGGQSWGESVRQRTREALNEYIGDPPPTDQSGSGLRRKYRKKKSSSSSKSHGRPASKKRKRANRKKSKKNKKRKFDIFA